MNTVSKAQAFMAWVDMGDARSVNGLFTQLKDHGYAIGRATLMKWKDEEEWEKRLPELLAAREMAQEAVKTAAAAQAVLEEAGASVDNQLRVLAIDPDDKDAFTVRDKLESVLETLAGVAVKLAEVSQRGLDKLDLNELSMKPSELLTFIKATGDTAQAAANVHKTLNPPAILPKGKGAIEGEVLPPQHDEDPDDLEDLRQRLLNAPRLKTIGK